MAQGLPSTADVTFMLRLVYVEDKQCRSRSASLCNGGISGLWPSTELNGKIPGRELVGNVSEGLD